MASCATPANVDAAIIYSTDEPLEGEFVEFRPLYEGPLVAANKGKTRAPEKQALRSHFHKQLAQLWSANPNLLRMAQLQGYYAASHIPGGTPDSFIAVAQQPGIYVGALASLSEKENLDYAKAGLNHLGEKWDRLGFKFVPLVTEDLCLQCSLEILFLRPSDSGTLIHGGDLDNRLKTLFDGLRLPENLDEVAGAVPGPDETPFFCLLQDDKLISEVKVTTDNLLLLPNEREPKPNDVFLAITVRLNPTIPHNWNWVFRQ
ncbi:MAG: hypothetical protein ACLQMG_16930 [Terracidiphilus sp.]